VNVLAPEVLIPAAAALAGLVLGVLFGRTGRRARQRVEELEVRVSEREARIGQLEAAQAELEARLTTAEAERDEASDALAGYQQEVAGHFSQTSELLKEMTLQYRNIYEHLAQGAEALCPEGSRSIESHAPIDALPDAGRNGDGASGSARDRAPASADDDGESVESAHQDPPLQVDPRPDA
jgi:uncharacterized membrane-anchored protein YhcB (DUF1043 family)